MHSSMAWFHAELTYLVRGRARGRGGVRVKVKVRVRVRVRVHGLTTTTTTTTTTTAPVVGRDDSDALDAEGLEGLALV